MNNKKLCELCDKKATKLYLLKVDIERPIYRYIYACEECRKAEENLGKESFPKD